MDGQSRGSETYRAGVALAVVTALLSVWTTIVRDDGNGIGAFMVIMAVAVGWFAAGFRAADMARAMAAAALMQGAVGALIATAPVTASVPGGSARALLFCGVLALLWFGAGVLFRAAARGGRD
jgi:hypothetical protein